MNTSMNKCSCTSKSIKLYGVMYMNVSVFWLELFLNAFWKCQTKYEYHEQFAIHVCPKKYLPLKSDIPQNWFQQKISCLHSLVIILYMLMYLFLHVVSQLSQSLSVYLSVSLSVSIFLPVILFFPVCVSIPHTHSLSLSFSFLISIIHIFSL